MSSEKLVQTKAYVKLVVERNKGETELKNLIFQSAYAMHLKFGGSMCLDKSLHILPKKCYRIHRCHGNGKNIDFIGPFCAQLSLVTVHLITLKLGKITTGVYILNLTERNFDKLLITLTIGK